MFHYLLFLVPATLGSRRGVSSLEYAILAFGVIGAVSAAMGVFSTGLSNIFQDIIADLPTHSNG